MKAGVWGEGGEVRSVNARDEGFESKGYEEL